MHPSNDTFPGEAFLYLAADALAWSGPSRADPVALQDAGPVPGRAQFCVADRRKLQLAVLAAATVHGGAEPDLLDEVAWWQADDFWQ